MKVSFSIRSKSETASIYVRLRLDDADVKIKTPFVVNPKYFKKGKTIQKSLVGLDAVSKKPLIQINKSLQLLQTKLNGLESVIVERVNSKKEYEIINPDWLNEIVNPKKNIVPTLLTEYFDYYFEDKRTLKHSTVKRMKSVGKRIEKYEKEKGSIYFAEINKSFRNDISKWMTKNGYAPNTTLKMLKIIRTICNHAKDNGILTHPDIDTFVKGMRFQKTPHVYLTLNDIGKIENLNLLHKKYDIARDWLIISCYTAQRISDFLHFTKDNIVEMEGVKFLDINQQKTSTPVYIPINDKVLNILNKYNGNFPPALTKNPASNEVLYNRYIKKVCEKAKINEVVTASLRQKKTNRFKIVEVPKWKAVSSHIGRRSFATNYYGKINTALLISATGHASEKQFLAYVGKKPQSNAIALAKELRRLSIEQGNEPQMTVVKNATNG